MNTQATETITDYQPAPQVCPAKYARAWILVLAIILGGAAVFPFAQSIYFDFVWDDLFLIKNNSKLDNPDYLRQIWVSEFFEPIAQPGNSFYWRPLVHFSFWIDLQLHGREPTGFHLTNLVLYGILTTLLFLLYQRYLGLTASVLATLLYAWHPLRTETVCWVSARTDSMALLFGMASILLFFRGIARERARWGWIVLSMFSLALALVSKESAVLIPLFAILLEHRRMRTHLVASICFFLPVVAWYPLRSIAVDHGRWFQQLVEPEMVPAAAVKALVHYITVHFWPVGLSTEPWFVFPTSYSEPLVLAGFGVILVFMGIIARFRNELSAGILWFVIALTPYLHILPLPERAADRYTAMASIGFAMSIAAAWQRIPQRSLRAFFLAVIVLAIGCCAGISWHLAPSWISDADIEHRAAEHGESPQALFYRAKEAVRNQEYQVAYDHYMLAMERTHQPTAVLVFDLAMTEIQLQKIEEAVAHLELLQEIYPQHPIGGMILGELYMRIGEFQQALRIMAKQAGVFPDNPVPHLVQGQIYMDFLNQPQKALTHFREALRRNPDNRQRQFIEERIRQLVQNRPNR
ncbi:glycosyltransferase family 39 protein [bacterium]|nr:glycosyltransferase family 39 protein [candidate division CSSED10-310 bacterium]